MLRIAGRTAGPKKKFQLFFQLVINLSKIYCFIQGYPKRMRLQRRLYWNYSVLLYIFMVPSFFSVSNSLLFTNYSEAKFSLYCTLYWIRGYESTLVNQTNNSLDEWSLEITSIVPLNLFCPIHAIICLMMIIIWKPRIRSVCWQNKPKMSAWIKPMPLLDKGRLFCKIKAYSQWPAIMFQDKMKIEKLFWLLDRQLSTFSSSSFIY